MSPRHARPVSRDLPPTPDDTTERVDEMDAKVDAEVRAAAEPSTPAADRAPESAAPEPPD
ncbi:MAG TPA: hypothetical protein VMZ00_10120 [Sporichthya sp.]|nr:hypothetical protein [Sporichthya sp.]